MFSTEKSDNFVREIGLGTLFEISECTKELLAECQAVMNPREEFSSPLAIENSIELLIKYLWHAQ